MLLHASLYTVSRARSRTFGKMGNPAAKSARRRRALANPGQLTYARFIWRTPAAAVHADTAARDGETHVRPAEIRPHQRGRPARRLPVRKRPHTHRAQDRTDRQPVEDRPEADPDR